jgi:hypothetical protein
MDRDGSLVAGVARAGRGLPLVGQGCMSESEVNWPGHAPPPPLSPAFPSPSISPTRAPVPNQPAPTTDRSTLSAWRAAASCATSWSPAPSLGPPSIPRHASFGILCVQMRCFGGDGSGGLSSQPPHLISNAFVCAGPGPARAGSSPAGLGRCVVDGLNGVCPAWPPRATATRGREALVGTIASLCILCVQMLCFGCGSAGLMRGRWVEWRLPRLATRATATRGRGALVGTIACD